MKIDKKRLLKIALIILASLLVLIISWLHLNQLYNLTLKTATIIGVTINILLILDTYVSNKDFKSVYLLFQILSLPFLYGQLFTRYVLGITMPNQYDLAPYVDINTEIIAIILIAFCQLGMHLGYSIPAKTNENKDVHNISNPKTSKKYLLILGVILIAISAIPTFINYSDNFKAAFLGGYSAKRALAVNGYLSISTKIVPFFFIGIISLIIALQDNGKLQKFIFIFALLFYASQILFGNRGLPIIYAVMIAWTYYCYLGKHKIKAKNIILVVIIIFVSSVALNFIRENRGIGISEWGKKINSSAVAANNPILDICYEMGVTIYPITYTMQVVPNKIDYKKGKNYIYSILSVIIINLDGNKNEGFKKKMDISNEISSYAGIPFGGSYIQEAYANFGRFSIIIMIIFGILLKKFDNFISKKTNMIYAVLLIYISVSILWSIRNTTTSIPREVVWYSGSTYLLYLIIKSRIKPERSKR